MMGSESCGGIRARPSTAETQTCTWMAGIRRASASGSACNSASSSSTSRIHGCGVTILSSSSFMMYQWELDHQQRPLLWTILDRDGSLVVLNYSVRDGQAQAHPLAH